MISPSVGRKVWYRPSAFDRSGPIPMITKGDDPLDATVLAVWNDRLVNVLVFDISGKPFTKTSVTLIQEGDVTPKNAEGMEVYGYVEWMPYQVGQAKKHADEMAIAYTDKMTESTNVSGVAK